MSNRACNSACKLIAEAGDMLINTLLIETPCSPLARNTRADTRAGPTVKFCRGGHVTLGDALFEQEVLPGIHAI